ncbi:MAG: xanthine dehydrogenase family protein molybdopterin-binding subunit [Xanthobacteraceae bacterium]|jgi:carbon-monoxide dehydrogenase large subunit
MNPTGIGARVIRREDRRFITGRGRYTDDINLPGMTWAVMVRSPHAHAWIRSVDTSGAHSAPGVLTVLTGEDAIKAGLGGLPCLVFPSGSGHFRPTYAVLASGKVRYVGETVAVVVAESLLQAKHAAELITVDYEPLESVTLADARKANAPRIWEEAWENVGFTIERGNAANVEREFARAAHVTTLKVTYPRITANSIEPRNAVAFQDQASGRLTLYTSTQNPFLVRETLAAVLRLPEINLRVVAGDVGGAFGMKSQVYPEEILVVWAAARLNRPVKWCGERSECIATDTHGRHQIADTALAFDSNGKILAFRTAVDVDLGAYLANSAGVPPLNAAMSYPGTYDIPASYAISRAVFTTTCPTNPYRGSGKPEATYVMERLMDKAARSMNIDPIALRRRNLIAPSAMPYRTSGGNIYTEGDFEKALDKALALGAWDGFAARRLESKARGMLRGIGVAMHCQRAGSQSERMEIRFASDGTIFVHAGTLSTGQGHETMFAQMLCNWFGVSLEDVRVEQGDTETSLYGRGTFAQRSMSAGGSALKLAADEVLQRGKRFSAWMLEAAESDIVFENGFFRIKGTDRQVSLKEVAKASYAGIGMPPELGIGLSGTGSHPGPNTFPNGCMICELEVDPDTGKVCLVGIAAVDDVGVVVNPLTLEGQLHGSTAQGIGEALLEEIIYSPDSGQLVTGSFMDYSMPRAEDLPAIVTEHSLAPTKTNLLGVKGGSEAGNVGAPPAIANALIDALAGFGVNDIALPATSERIWQAIRTNSPKSTKTRAQS